MLGRGEPGEPGYDAEKRLGLSWATRQASERDAPLSLAPENLDQLADAVIEPRPPSRKLDEVLLLLARRTASFGDVVVMNADADWPLVSGRKGIEFNRLLHALRDQRLVTEQPGSSYVLTASGWERVQELEAERPTSTIAFVAMAFAPAMIPAFDNGFYPCLHGLGYDPVRVDREQYLGKIDDFIIASIRKSALLVADFTGMRTGVFFEAGFGLGLGIPVVWTCRQDHVAQLDQHFDTRQYNHLIWTEPADLAASLRTRIEAAVTARPRPRT
jgi:hypothetical protein